MRTIEQLRRLRWGVLVAVVLGIAGSITLNVLHAPSGNPIARAIAGAPPLAVFATIELISRIPSSSKLLSFGRISASMAVALVGGSISYVQQMNYVRDLGFARWEASIWPISIDGLMIVATLSLVEVVRKIRQLEEAQATVTTPIARLRAVADQHEDEKTLAYRAAATNLRKVSHLAERSSAAASN